MVTDLSDNKYVCWIKRINVAVGISFFIGIVLSVIFIGVNVNAEKDVPKNQGNTTAQIESDKAEDYKKSVEKTDGYGSSTPTNQATEEMKDVKDKDKKTKIIREDSGVPLPPVKPPAPQPAQDSATNSPKPKK